MSTFGAMDLNYRIYGSGPLDLIVLHGLLGSSKNWDTAAKALGEKFTVVVPDLRNHGESPHGPHSVELMREDILQLLMDLNLDEVFLLGHSMGGLAAISFSFTYPAQLKGLIVEDVAPTTKMSSMVPIFDAMDAVDLGRVKRREDADEQLAKKIADPPVRQFLLRNLKREVDGKYTWRCNLPELRRFVEETSFVLRQQDRFTGPTLFVGGGRSEHRIARQEEVIGRHFPGFQLRIIQGSGHWVHFEAMNEFVETVSDFLMEHS
ncbi:alpha/beta fold hydrolase [bacterium]|nr:alpha/beta fold hydrolase [bacterium]